MFILKEAWESIARHRVLSVVSATTTVVVTAATLMGLAIIHTDTKAQTSAYDTQKVDAIISLDKAKIKKKNATTDIDWSKYELSWEQYSTYAEAAGVTLNAYYYETASAKTSDGVKTVSATTDTDTSGTVSLVGTSSSVATASLPNKGFSLVSGKTVDYTATAVSNKAVVSQAFAKANNYKVGSKFKLVNPSDSKKTIEFTVNGIYKDHAAAAKVSSQYNDATPANNAIYVSSYTFMGDGFYSATKPGSTGHDLRIVFELSSPKDYNTFVKKARAAGLSSNYTMSSPSLAQYEAKVAPLSSLAQVTKISVIVIGIAGAIILLACLILSWKRRNEDIGMLIGVGVGRGKITWRYAVELLMIAVPAVLAGLAIGYGLSFAVAGAVPASSVVRATPTLSVVKNIALGSVVFWAICCVAAIVRVACFTTHTLLDAVSYESSSAKTELVEDLNEDTTTHVHEATTETGKKEVSA